MTASLLCPRCGLVSESALHAILQFGPAKEVWGQLGLQWVVEQMMLAFGIGWLTILVVRMLLGEAKL